MIRVGISGGSGYVGGELISLALSHPECELVWVGSRENAGLPVGQVHRTLDGRTSLNFSSPSEIPGDLDLLFVAHPHGQSMEPIRTLLSERSEGNRAPKVIDLGADFRLPQNAFESTYEVKHLAASLLKDAVYGTPELCPEKIKSASLVANPGCFAHCITLALAPLAYTKLLRGVAVASAITGSSGSGIKVTAKTHHPERNDSLAAYEIWTHRHTPEIESALAVASGGELQPKLRLVPISGPFTRGIFATCYAEIETGGPDVVDLYKSFARENVFVRYRDDTPRLIDVRGTNFCDLSVRQSGTEVVIVAAIDNLVKGAAGNAIQCMNLMFGLDESLGLLGVSK